MTLVCDSCGHTVPHDRGTPKSVPYQPKGTTAHVTLSLTECQRSWCHCNLPVWRDLLPSEPAL